MEQLEPGAPGPALTDAKAKASKPRATKTPLQKEVLEASYQLNQHPSVEHRKALGDRIGLTEQEVQAWFQNRRRRDKKASTGPGGTPGPAAPSTSGGVPGTGASPAPAGAVPGAPAGTVPFTQPATGTPGAAEAGPGSGSAKPKAPRAPKAAKLSPVAPGAAAALAAAAPPVGLPPLPPGAPAGPAGLARFAPVPAPPGLAHHAPAPAAAAAAASGGGGSALSQPSAGEEETEDGGADEYEDSATAAAWEGVRALCVAARATLPVPYREDGPPLGFLFDEPGDAPPVAVSAGGGGKRRRIVLSGGDVAAEADEEGVKSVLLRKPAGEKPGLPGAAPVGVMTQAELEMRRRELALLQQQQQLLLQQQQMAAGAGEEADPDFMLGGRGRGEETMRKEQERLRRELLKQQEQLERARRREEEQQHREMERGEKERRKMVDRLEKERAKEEARKLKELERMKIAEERELRRMEAAREKERKAEERRRAVEERKKEKETARALAQQERAVLRMRHREAGGPPDDEELEYRALLVAAGIDPATVADPDEDAAAGAAAAAPGGADQPMADAGAAAAPGTTPPPQPRKRPRPDLLRPEFPPPSLGLQPAWPPAAAGAEGAAAGADDDDGPCGEGWGSELLVVWSFLRSFADLLGLPCVPSLEGLLAALAGGELSGLLGDVHCSLLRLLQADMEDSHDERERIGRQTGAAPNFMDRSVVSFAARLEEVWAWGFELDAWRAHLNLLTWPEVLRQVAVAFGRGRPRPAVRRGAGAGEAAGKGPRIQGVAGEDVVDDGSGGGSLKLRMPSRYVLGTVKAAAWQVLAATGPSGLSVGDLVRRIQRSGLREMRSSKTPEAVLAGSLARDVLFTKVAPATWALSAVVAFHRRRNEARRKGGKGGGAAAAAGGGKADGGGGGAGAKGAGGGDTEMADAPAEVKQEGGPAVKQEAGAAAAGGGGGGRGKVGVKVEPKAEPDAGDGDGEGGGAGPMEVDGGAAVKQEEEEEEAVKQEPGTGEATPGPDPAHAAAGDGAANPANPSAAAGGGGGDQEDGEASYSGDEDEEEEGEGSGGAAGAGDPWVATLLTGGYNSLSLRERIEALSFLCHAVLDGPSLRVRLETRTNEAAARKKAVFEDAKNEKRKRAEEAAARAAAAAEEARKRAEAAAAAGSAGGQSRGTTPAPGGGVDARAIAGEIFGGAAAAAPMDPAKAAAEAARRAEEEEEDRRRQAQRAEEIRRIDEECAIRAEPLGSDRRYNRYWLFTPSSAPSSFPGSGAGDDGAAADASDASERAAADAGWARLWVESAPDGAWRLLTAPAQFDALAAALDPRGAREGQLAAALARVAERVKRSMPGAHLERPTSLESLPAAARCDLDTALAGRAEGVRLLAASCLAPGDDYTADVELPGSDCGRTRRLKRELLRLEAALPPEAVDGDFERSAWSEAVRTAAGPAALRSCLGQLEAALLPSPDGVSPGLLATVFHRHPPLVRGAWVEVGREVATALPGPASKEVLPPQERPDGAPAPAPSDEPLAWLPPTLPAVALRLLLLDACIIYRHGAPPGREVLAGYKYTLRPAPRDAQPAVMAAAAAEKASSSALPLGVGGGAVILTNILADRGRVREASRRVPELPLTTMVTRAREFTIPVDEMRASVAEAERQGLAAPHAAAAAAHGTGKGKSKSKGGKGGDAAAAPPPPQKSCGSRSVVVVSGRGVAAPKNKGAVKAKGTAPPPSAARVKPSAKGGRGKAAVAAAAAAAAAAAEEAEPDEDPAAGGGALLGAEYDEEEPGFASDEEDDAPEEGYDDPYDSDYR